MYLTETRTHCITKVDYLKALIVVVDFGAQLN